MKNSRQKNKLKFYRKNWKRKKNMTQFFSNQIVEIPVTCSFTWSATNNYYFHTPSLPKTK